MSQICSQSLATINFYELTYNQTNNVFNSNANAKLSHRRNVRISQYQIVVQCLESSVNERVTN